VDDSKFREDLFYRLNVLRVSIPPLRVRQGDVARLARYFLRELAVTQGMEVVGLTPEAEAVLEGHNWPGNVRELKNTLERAVVMCEGEKIDLAHLTLSARPGRPLLDTNPAIGGVIQVPTAGRSLRSVEAELVRMTLRLTGGNKSAAARVLGISRPTLHRKIDEYQLAEASA
jgi:DNA-binding NtrC family response regulator